jgi:hypothetical protein
MTTGELIFGFFIVCLLALLWHQVLVAYRLYEQQTKRCPDHVKKNHRCCCLRCRDDYET